MFSVFAIGLALLAQPNDDPSVWQTIGRDTDGSTVLLNPDTVTTGENGPEAMVRVRHARPSAVGGVLSDYETAFNCSTRMATRKLMGERDAAGEIVARNDEGLRAPPVRAAAGTPMGQVLDQVCAMTAG